MAMSESAGFLYLGMSGNGFTGIYRTLRACKIIAILINIGQSH
jgi:hypothetical protein